MTDPSHSEQTQTAPRGFWPVLRKLGPGLIISGSIVGSGELIATTTLGAEVGFVALWLIIVSCGIKVVVQEELGRYVVSSGETTLQGLNRVPGPRWRVSWVVWCWWIMTLGVIIQGGGIVGGVGQTFHLFVPQISGTAWAMVAAVTVMALLFRGHYGRVEKICVGMVVSFTFVTIACAVLLGWTPFAPTTEDFLSGLRFGLPEGGIAVAFAAFGITDDHRRSTKGRGALRRLLGPGYVFRRKRFLLCHGHFGCSCRFGPSGQDLRISTVPPRGPGTAPRTATTFSWASTRTIRRLRTVTRSRPC